MKLALLNDTHYGIKNDSPYFLDHTKKFMDDLFIPYLKNNNINTIIHLGDLVDRRKYININTSHRLRTEFLDVLQNNNITMAIILGNHDIYLKNTLSVNSLNEIIKNKYSNVTIIDKPSEIFFDNKKILMLPWICDDNQNETLELIKNTDAKIVMSHLELSGFCMYKGSLLSHGMDSNIFYKFNKVFSGHYHHKSTKGNIYYLGSQLEFTWADFEDPKGFHIFDTDTNDLTFIKNPVTIFEKIWYNDNYSDMDFSKYSNKIIKVIVQSNTNQIRFENFMEELEKVNPIEIQVVEDNLNMGLENSEDIIDEVGSTIDICNAYINNIDNNFDKNKIKKIINELYFEALNIS